MWEIGGKDAEIVSMHCKNNVESWDEKDNETSTVEKRKEHGNVSETSCG